MSNIFSELNICLLFVIIPISQLDISQDTKNSIDDILVLIVYAIMGGNMILSMIMTVIKVIKLIRMKMGTDQDSSNTSTQKVVQDLQCNPRFETMD
jgi:hypothetical protein